MGIKGNITIEEILEIGLDNLTIIDVRSPAEYQEDHIPGAINIPILDNEERKEIGIIYKNEGPNKAKLRGVDIVSPKLPDFVKTIYKICMLKKPVVIYCWRGGLRSEASVTFLRLAGISVSKLLGGYKAYRKYVLNYLENIHEKIKFITLFGPTCSGKTEILNKLKAKGYPVLNFEKYARHKGSNFGHIGEAEFPFITQKKFDSELFYDLYSQNSSLYFVEGESIKIGKVAIPKLIFNKIKTGYKIFIDADINFRIDFALKAYKADKFESEILNSLIHTKKYIDNKTYNYLHSLLSEKNFKEFTRVIMLKYYDPLYKKGMPNTFDFKINLTDIDDACNKIIKIFENINTIPFAV